MKKTFLFAGVALIAGVVSAAATISDVVVRQRWPWGREVDVYFTLAGATEPVSVEPTFTARGGENIPLVGGALSGARFYLSDGRHHLVWNPAAASYGGRTLFADVDVSLAIARNPLYMIVDLDALETATNQVEYVYADDIRAGRWGAWEENDTWGVPIWTGVTNGLTYKQGKIALRYIPPTTSAEWMAMKGTNTFMLGAPDGTPNADSPTNAASDAVCAVARCQPQGEVTLTRGYWIGVFEVTQRQWTKLGFWNTANNKNSDGTRPMENCEWQNVRGRNKESGRQMANWPRDGFKVAPNSYLARLRARTGLLFDVPTEAQWEYAARAGVDDLCDDDRTAVAQFAQRAETATAVVGSYRPNAWGLYDTLGNVREVTRSAWDDSGYKAADFGDDPKGQVLDDPFRVSRGGGWNDGAAAVNLHYREQNAWNSGYDTYKRHSGEGFRLWLPLDN